MHPTLLMEALVGLVQQAGALILQVYERDFSVLAKTDASPVTEADWRAEALITPALQVLLPGVPVLAEEATAAGLAPTAAGLGERFWLVDPLDGTREFVQRNGEFTVNVALIEQGRPVLGVVLAPALGQLYAGAVGCGAFVQTGADAGTRRPIEARRPPAEGLTVLASRAHGNQVALNAFLADRLVARIRPAGSSLKLCLLAAGEADCYPRFGRTMEWDIAAGQAVLEAAGGRIEDLEGQPLRYGKPGLENPDFVAWGQHADAAAGTS